MTKKIKELLLKIENEEIADNDFFDNDLILDIINLADVSMFHLILNYVEKINVAYASYIMDVKKDRNNRLIYSFDSSANLFDRDKTIISKINEYIEKKQTSLKFLDEKDSEIYDKYKDKLENFQEIKEVIDNSLDYSRPFDYAVNQIKERRLIRDISVIKIIYSLYNELKEFYTIYNNLDSEIQKVRDNLLLLLEHSYSEELQESIKKNIKNGQVETIGQLINSKNTELIRNILISSFFEEVPENFIKNLSNIVSFQLKIEQNFIEPEMLRVYQTILSSFQKDDSTELINLYKYMLQSNVDYKSKFYDDFTDARKVESKLLMDSVYKVDEKEENYGIIDGVKYYALTGEPFYMMIHGSTQQITDFQSGPHDGTSMSFISGDRLNVFNDGVIYGFNTLNPEQFIELYTRDTSTEFDIGKEQKSMMEAVPYYYTPKEFIKNTPNYQYNEILYLSGKEESRNLIPPKPSYIVCIDDINSESIEAAKTLQIPIVKIYTKYYPKIQKNTMGHFAFLDDVDTYKTL